MLAKTALIKLVELMEQNEATNLIFFKKVPLMVELYQNGKFISSFIWNDEYWETI